MQVSGGLIVGTAVAIAIGPLDCAFGQIGVLEDNEGPILRGQVSEPAGVAKEGVGFSVVVADGAVVGTLWGSGTGWEVVLSRAEDGGLVGMTEVPLGVLGESVPGHVDALAVPVKVVVAGGTWALFVEAWVRDVLGTVASALSLVAELDLEGDVGLAASIRILTMQLLSSDRDGVACVEAVLDVKRALAAAFEASPRAANQPAAVELVELVEVLTLLAAGA